MIEICKCLVSSPITSSLSLRLHSIENTGNLQGIYARNEEWIERVDDFQMIYGWERETRRAKAEGVQKVEGKGEAEKQKRILNVTKIL